MRMECGLIKTVCRPHLRRIDIDLRHRVFGDALLMQIVDYADNLELAGFSPLLPAMPRLNLLTSPFVGS